MDKIKQKKIYDIIIDDNFPENQIHFCDEFYKVSRNWYLASGYAIVEGKGYSFSWNDNDGIYEEYIEEDLNAFDYLEVDKK
jgi:hypothetical protein